MTTIQERCKAALPKMAAWRDTIRAQAKRLGISPSVIGAVIIRETRADPKAGGKDALPFVGDGGRGCGPMQVDVGTDLAFCEQWKAGKLTPEQGIVRGCDILRQKMKEVEKSPTIQADKRLACSVAAYNCGTGNVRKALARGLSFEAYTAHGNYASDVLALAKGLSDLGFDADDADDAKKPENAGEGEGGGSYGGCA